MVVPVECRIGEGGEGVRYILDSLNPERILNAADLMTMHAAGLYDSGQPCGAQANAAKYLAADAGFRACDRAIRTHGGMGYAAEYHVERYFREMVATQLAPVPREMILCSIAERALGLPKSC